MAIKKKPATKESTTKLPKEKSWQVYLLLGIAVALYFNSLFNEYAFDDYTYIAESSYVQEGFSGIGKLLKSDALESYIKGKGGSANDLSGGRYRPLSLVTFAIEQQIFKGNPFEGHLVNVLLYALTALVLFRFLNRRIFNGQPWMAFLTTLIFTIHPLHTEVVANIKSRDEILSLLFIILSLEYFFRYLSTKSTKEKLASWSFFFLALLSKEYALMLVFLVPILSYVLLKKERGNSFRASIPFWTIAFLYFIIRVNIVGFQQGYSSMITNNPYMLANFQEEWATKIFVLFYYIKLIFLPYPLSCDYSFDTFTFRTFADPLVILSILVYAAIIYFAFYFLRKRNILSIGIFIFLLPLFFVSNFIMDIGATMGERLVYHSSLGFSIVLCYGIVKGLNKLVDKENTRQVVVLSLAGILTVAAAVIIIPRNEQWKNSVTLFTHDVNVVPRSLLMNHNAGTKLADIAIASTDSVVKDSLFKEAIFLLKRGMNVYSGWNYLYVSLGYVYYKMGDWEHAEQFWKQAIEKFPNEVTAASNLKALATDYLNRGMEAGKKGDMEKALADTKRAIEVDSTNASLWYNLGGIYYSRKDYTMARQMWEKTLSIDPNYQDARGGLNAIRGL